MINKHFRHFVWLFLAMLGMTQTAMAEWRDFEVELRNATSGILTSEETSNSQTITFGLAVAADGTVSRVTADAADAAVVITGKTGNDHGLQNFTATFAVESAVKITTSTCSWGGEATVKNAGGTQVATFTTKKGEGGSGCYVGGKGTSENIISVKYTGDATTLTVSGGAYIGYFAVEAISATAANVSYSLGDADCKGTTVPAGGTYAVGDDYTISAKNFTLYKEGYTLTGWTDGTKTYATGETITLEGDLALTPVFTANAVSLADRTEPVTLQWTFRKDQGAPSVEWQGKDGLVWVTQATIGGKTIDVALPFSTNPGKFNNSKWSDWCQLNDGTVFTVPSCKGATISIEGYNVLGDPATTGSQNVLTIDGQTDYTHGKTVSYEIAGTAETIDVVIGNEGSYYRYIQAVLPVVEQSGGGQTYTGEEVLVRWPFDKHPATGEDYTVTKSVDGVITAASFDIVGDLSKSTKVENPLDTGSRSKDPDNGLKFLTFTGESNMQLHWYIKPSAGLTFTPTQIKMYVQRFGTDKKDGVVVTAKKEGGEVTTLGTYTARRANWDDSQETKKWGSLPDNLVNEVVIDLTAAQQAALASGEGFHLYAATGLGNEKAGGFADIRIAGKVDGSMADIESYTLAVAAAPAEGGTVTKYPNSDKYEDGTEVTLTATKNFGYKFVNWTNAAGKEVSTEAKFKYPVEADETLTANFQKVATYELKLTVDGTNDYMVQPTPAPTVVDGKNMYEEGATVVLTASSYDGLVTFTNWNDGSTNSELNLTMDGDKDITATYAQADIIAGWDFYKAGGSGRKADFAAQDNDSDALNLVKTGTTETSGWLDKSYLGGGGYESFTGAAVNWRTGASNGDVGNWHWQTKVNAEAFTDINVQFQMLYNYNSYQRYNVEYSLDGENWKNAGNITMTGAKSPASFSGKLNAEANNQKELYIRLIADKTSTVDGSASANDGNALAMFFITGSPKLIDDGTAPKLVGSVPANNAENASATGKIVLTFDERVKVKDGAQGDLSGTKLEPTVSGKSIVFNYKNLDYATDYTFTLAANTVADLTDNFISNAITINFKTMERPTVVKAPYDVEVSTVDELLDAIKTANSRSDQNTRFRIFIKKGTYTIPLSSAMKTVNGYEVPECITFISGKNISFIGEDRDATIITNGIPADATFAGTYGTTSKYDGIGNSDVFQIASSSTGLYWQDLTVSTGMEDARGRDIAIQDKGSKNIYKNVKLHGYQDTWTSNNDNGLYYFEGGIVRGRTDYLCGKGDIFFNGVELQQVAGGYAAVPSKPANIGWVFKDCVINGDGAGVDGNYTLGRPWGSGTPVAVFIDTRMNVVPSAIGWNEMSGGWPKRFAEWNSTTSTGSVIDLSSRKTSFGEKKDDKGNIVVPAKSNDPKLTQEEADAYSDMAAMYGDWMPTLATEQAPVPANVKLEGNTLTWDDSNYALLWAICKDGEVVAFSTTNTFDITTIPSTAAADVAPVSPVYTVRAANEMGGLSEAAEAQISTGIETVKTGYTPSADDAIYTLQGVRVNKAGKGVYIINGKKVVVK